MPDRDDIDTDDAPDLVPRSHIRDLEAKAREADELKSQLAAVQREAAFAKALGSAVEHPGAKYFVKGYDGELTAEAIRNAAAEAGFLSAETKPSQSPQNPTDPDLAAYQRINDASSGAPSGAGGVSFEEAVANANSQEEVLAICERFRPGSTTASLQG